MIENCYLCNRSALKSLLASFSTSNFNPPRRTNLIQTIESDIRRRNLTTLSPADDDYWPDRRGRKTRESESISLNLLFKISVIFLHRIWWSGVVRDAARSRVQNQAPATHGKTVFLLRSLHTQEIKYIIYCILLSILLHLETNNYTGHVLCILPP